MKILSIFSFLLLSISVLGQKLEVMAILHKYDISEEFLNSSLQDHDATHSFDIKTTVNDGTKDLVEIGHFNPELKVGKRWTLESINGQPPSKKELKNFDKTYNTKKRDINGLVDDNSWKITSETDNEIVISFKYTEESLPHKFAFLADCTGSAYINKKRNDLKRQNLLMTDL